MNRSELVLTSSEEPGAGAGAEGGEAERGEERGAPAGVPFVVERAAAKRIDCVGDGLGRELRMPEPATA